MASVLIENARIIFPHSVSGAGWLLVYDGTIEDFGVGRYQGTASVNHRIDAEGRYLSPGFIDLHVHGGGGADFRDCSVAASLTALRTHLAGGTTTIFPTISSVGLDTTLESIACYNALYAQADRYSDIPNLAGIHLEGPYFSYKQRGAQDSAFLRDPDPAEYLRILDSSEHIRRWSLACELPGAFELARELRRRNICVSVGHSNATTAQVFEAFTNGFSCVTHLYSGCSVVHRNGPFREGGVVEAAFLLDDLDVEVIGDGIHLPPDFLKLIFKVKGIDRVALITDCIRAGGLKHEELNEVYDDKEKTRRIFIESGVAVMPDRKNFAGSIATTSRIVHTAWKKAEIPLADAVRMSSLIPARMQHIDWVAGSIAKGKRADLVIFDENVDVFAVLVRGIQAI